MCTAAEFVNGFEAFYANKHSLLASWLPRFPPKRGMEPRCAPTWWRFRSKLLPVLCSKRSCPTVSYNFHEFCRLPTFNFDQEPMF